MGERRSLGAQWLDDLARAIDLGEVSDEASDVVRQLADRHEALERVAAKARKIRKTFGPLDDALAAFDREEAERG